MNVEEIREWTLMAWKGQLAASGVSGSLPGIAAALVEALEPDWTVRVDEAAFTAQLGRRAHMRSFSAFQAGCARLASVGLLERVEEYRYRLTVPGAAPLTVCIPVDTPHASDRTWIEPEPIGLPAGRLPLDFSGCAPAATGRLLNNVGDPYSGAMTGAAEAKDFEGSVIDTCLDLVGAPRDEQRFGWVTSGSSEAIRHGLLLGRARHPGAPVYVSAAAHPCVPAAASMLGMEIITVPVLDHDVLDYDALARLADPTRAAVMVATAGTTMAEAIDDVPRIRATLAAAGVEEVWVHLDAALAGPALALDRRWSESMRMGEDRANSVSWSGHKFLSVPIPCGVLLARREDAVACAHMIPYVGATNLTTACSRPGVTSLMLWQALTQHGHSWLGQQADRARTTAERLRVRLVEAGVDAHRHEAGFTVTFPVPSEELAARWSLATSGDRAHVVVMPGLRPALIDAFADELILSRSLVGAA